MTIYRGATIVFVALVVIGLASLFLPKVRQNRARQRMLTSLEEENRMREEMIQQLQQQQERFANDPRYVERIAREELGKAKPGEMIFRFSPTNEGARRATGAP